MGGLNGKASPLHTCPPCFHRSSPQAPAASFKSSLYAVLHLYSWLLPVAGSALRRPVLSAQAQSPATPEWRWGGQVDGEGMAFLPSLLGVRGGPACTRCSVSVCQGSGRIPAQTPLTEESHGTSGQQRKDRRLNKLSANDQLTSAE